MLATTALREAENRAYVVDQIKIRNGLTVLGLEMAEGPSSAMSRLPRPKAISSSSDQIGRAGDGMARPPRPVTCVWGSQTQRDAQQSGGSDRPVDLVLGEYADAYF